MGDLDLNVGVIGVIVVYLLFIICIRILDRSVRKKIEKLKEDLNNIGIDDDVDLCHCKKRDMGIGFSENGIEYCLECGLDLP